MLYAATPSGGSSDYYRADGQRIEKVANASLTWFQASRTSGQYDLNFATSGASTRYFYDGQMGMEDDYNPSGSVTKVNRYGLGARGIDRVEVWDGTNTTYGYPLYDGHGNMRTTLGRNGTGYTTGTFKTYDVWGSVRSGGGSSDLTQKYCASLGHVSDDDSGLIYMRARYHEPSTGRFLSEDVARDGHNWFVYCDNDPLKHVDITGQAKKSLTALFAWFLTNTITTLIGLGGPVGNVIAVLVAFIFFMTDTEEAISRAADRAFGYLSRTFKTLRATMSGPQGEAAEKSLAAPAVRGIAGRSGEAFGGLLDLKAEEEALIRWGSDGGLIP